MNVGGTATWLNNLDLELQKQGCLVGLIYGHTQPPELESQIIEHDLSVSVGGLGKSVGISSTFKAIFEVRRVIEEFRPEVINTHTSKGGLIGRLANLSLGRNRVAIVHTFHGHIFTGYFNKFISKIFVLIEKLLAHFTDLILVSGSEVNRQLEIRKISNQSKRIVVFPGIQYKKKKQLKNLTAFSFRVGWLGRITQIKRPDRVISLAKAFPQIEFIVAGDGELRSEIEKSAPENVIFKGWVNPENLWSVVDLALLTSDNEAMPYSLIEAGMQGLPAITTDVGSTSEVVIDGETGYVVQTNISSLSGALKQFIDHPELLAKFGENAQKWTSDKFNVERMAKVHLDAYQMAIDTK